MSRVKEAFQKLLHPINNWVEWHPSRSDAALGLAAFICVPVLIALLITLLCQKDIRTWYRTSLKKPRFALPVYLFGPAWFLVYVAEGFAGWLIWTHGGLDKQGVPLGFYGAQLLLSLAASPVLLKARKLDLALALAIGNLGLLASTFAAFHSVETLAAYVLLGPLAFIAYYVLLTYSFLTLNTQKNKRITSTLRKSFGKVIDSPKHH